MLVELNYVFLSVVIMLYAALLFLKRREKYTLYATLSFAFLLSSILLQMFSSTWWVYVMHFGILFRFLQLGGLVMFGGFVILAMMALRENSKLTFKHTNVVS